MRIIRGMFVLILVLFVELCLLSLSSLNFGTTSIKTKFTIVDAFAITKQKTTQKQFCIKIKKETRNLKINGRKFVLFDQYGLVSCSSSLTIPVSLSSSNNHNYENDEITNYDEGNNNNIWSPSLRIIMFGISSFGAIETGYLTYVKLFSGDTGAVAAKLFCGSGDSMSGIVSSCDLILNGPYSNIPFTDDVPLASVGFVAYILVSFLSIQPIVFASVRLSSSSSSAAIRMSDDDTTNRIFLTALSTTMGTFSIFLMTLLFGIIEPSLAGGKGGAAVVTTCPYCVFSATCSVLLANIAFIGGCLPSSSKNKKGFRMVAAGFVSALVGALVLFGAGSGIDSSIGTPIPMSSSLSPLSESVSGVPATTKQDREKQQTTLFRPPEITNDSSQRAIYVAKKLKSMDAKMYGAFWCSHCYEQKEAFGKQVFSYGDNSNSIFDSPSYTLEYIECSKDGVNSQTTLCKSKEIPGFPTWEINGKLYPGEKDLDELDALINNIEQGGK